MPRKSLAAQGSADASPRVARDGGVQVLARAGEILRLLKSSPSGMSQAEISNRLKLARSTVHRILSALASEGLVQASGSSSRYRLGQEILQMAEAARSALVTVVHPLLQSLSREVNETVDLSVLDRAQVTFIDQVVAPQRLRAVSAIGASFPLHCTANGKAVLASMNDRELDRALPGELEAMTSNTIVEFDALRAHLAEIRRTGVAFDREEHSLGICAVGAAVPNSPLGFAAISIPIPAQRFAEKKKAAAEALRRTAKAVDALWREEVA